MSPLIKAKSDALAPLRIAIGAASTSIIFATAAWAGTAIPLHATFVEPLGGPVSSPFECPAGTSCGSAQLGNLGNGTSVVVFNGCGSGCQVRTIVFDDGSQLVIFEYGNPADFSAPGNAGQHGYNAFGLPGNPQFLATTQVIAGGTGRFAGVTGDASGMVKVAGGVAVVVITGTIIFP